MKTIIITRTARKQIDAIAKPQRMMIIAKIEAYAANPAALANQVKRLQGSEFYRLRVGDYRVVFAEDGTVVTVTKVGHRREIYR